MKGKRHHTPEITVSRPQNLTTPNPTAVAMYGLQGRPVAAGVPGGFCDRASRAVLTVLQNFLHFFFFETFLKKKINKFSIFYLKCKLIPKTYKVYIIVGCSVMLLYTYVNQ